MTVDIMRMVLNNKKWLVIIRCILFLVLIVIILIIALWQPINGLDTTGHQVLAALITALAMWTLQPGSGSFFSGVMVILLGGTLAGLPMADLASGFVSPSLWLLISAMFLGYALLKTGLGRRTVFWLIQNTHLTYARILCGWFIIGLLFSLFTPLIMVRFLILTPIAVSLADACSLPQGSQGRSLIVIAAWAASIFPGLGWLNGSLYGPVFSEFLPLGSMRNLATSEAWFTIMGPPWLLFSVIFIILLYLLLKPEQELAITQEELRFMYVHLGPLKREEKSCLFIFIFVICGLLLQNFLHYQANLILFAAFILLMLCNVLSIKDLSSGINWDTVMFFGMILGLPHLLQSAGISAWLSPFLQLLLCRIAINPLLYVLSLYAVCLILRFADVAQGWIISAIFALGTPMLYEEYGLHPLISLMVFICASNLFFSRYHQPFIWQAEAIIGTNGWHRTHLFKASILYAILVVFLLAGCCLYWRVIGII